LKYVGDYTITGGKISMDFDGEIKISEKLDVLGYHCPMPVSFTRKKLQKMLVGEVLEVIADDPETKIDIPKLVDRLGCELLSFQEDNGEYTYLVIKK